MKFGIVPLLLRDEVAADYWGTIEKLAQMGFQGIEGAGPAAEGDLDEAKRGRERFDGLGIEIIGLGIGYHQLRERIDEMVEKARIFGCQHVIKYYAPAESAETLYADAALYNEIGRICSDAGLTYCYHHHDHELLAEFDGRSGLEILMDETDPEHVHMQFDSAWLMYGEVDPVAYLRQHAERVSLVHLKDVADPGTRGTFCALGAGHLPLREFIAAAEEAGVPWGALEQDRTRVLNPLQATQASAFILRERGYLS
ncbi:MAG: sugar phosphate isomerase/epimerase [Candidatus Latescibacterota bacterium]|nr:sugar phosphate isomerase/epimerase [Candidatus Latescibacterota bacterium]